jgi:effector-binding domain-containing protein
VPITVRIVRTASQPIAVIRDRVAPGELSRVVPSYCGEVWEFARAAGLDQPGRLVAVYLDGAITLECGVEVATPFAGTERVVCSHIPAGMAATATHVGPYAELGRAHDAIRRWCAESCASLAGPSWEVYGHWVEPPAQPRTDVYYLLKDAGAAG